MRKTVFFYYIFPRNKTIIVPFPRATDSTVGISYKILSVHCRLMICIMPYTLGNFLHLFHFKVVNSAKNLMTHIAFSSVNLCTIFIVFRIITIH